MADIQTYIEQIESAIYGKDVRQAIVDAINQCYADASEGITPEITTSEITGGTRVTVTVGSNSTHFDVMNGADGEDGTATDAQVETYVSAWLDDHPDATTTVEDGAISTAKLADGAVTEEKLDPNLELGVADNSVTTSKIVDHNVTMAKTDFYYKESLAHNYSWIVSGSGTQIARLYFKWQNMDTVYEEFPEVLSIVIPNVTGAWTSGGQGLSLKTTSHTEWLTKENTTITVNGIAYGVIRIPRSSFEEKYNILKPYVDDGESWKQSDFAITNAGGRIPDGPKYYVSGEITADLIEANFTESVMSEDFATAVKRAMESEEGTSTDEETAKNRLTGKVMICLGDSYTQMMASLLSSVATKYGMAIDNRGETSSSICGDVNGNKGYKPMWGRADVIVTNYASGYTIDGTSYNADDVGVIVFMGGANDGFGIETWVGTGIHETDTNLIYGACNHIFNVLAKTFTKAKLICITQPSHYVRTVASVPDDATAQIYGFENLAELQQMDDIQFSNYSMAVKEEAVYKTAYAYGWNIIDMFHDMPTMFNPSNRSAYWNSDKLHLTTAGYTLISRALDKKIVELVVG